MIGKEAFIVLEDYEQRQGRIYEDACDFGVLATDQARVNIRRAVEELKCLDEHFKASTEQYATGYTWKCKCQLLIERSDNYPGKYEGFVFNIEYIHSNVPMRPHKEHGYFTIDIKRKDNLSA